MHNREIYSGSHFKKILFKGFWYFLSSLNAKVVGVIILPIVTRYLTPSEYGVLNSIEAIIRLLPVLISLSLDIAFIRFYYNHNKKQEELKQYISTYFWFIIFWGVLILIIGFFIGKYFIIKLLSIPLLPFIPLILIAPLFYQLSMIGGIYLKQTLKSEYYSIIEMISFFIQILVYIYLLVFIKMGIVSRLYGFLIGYLLSFILYSFVLYKKKLISFSFNIVFLLEGLKFSIFLLPNYITNWVIGLSDRLILVTLATKIEAGLYSVGHKIGQSLRIFSISIFDVYTPIMFSMLIDNKKEDSLKKIEEFVTFYFFFIFWLAFFLGFFSKEIIQFLTESKYHKAYIYAPIVGFGYFFGAISIPFLQLIIFHEKTWITSTGAIIQSLFFILLNIVFIPKFGGIAAAWTSFSSNCFYFLWLYFWSQSIEKIRIEFSKIVKILLLGLFIISFYLLLQKIFNFDLILRLAVKFIFVILVIILSFLLKLINIESIKIYLFRIMIKRNNHNNMK